jgi:hypothetical protein
MVAWTAVALSKASSFQGEHGDVIILSEKAETKEWQ